MASNHRNIALGQYLHDEIERTHGVDINQQFIQEAIIRFLAKQDYRIIKESTYVSKRTK